MKNLMFFVITCFIGAIVTNAQQTSPSHSINTNYMAGSLSIYDTGKAGVKDYDYYNEKSLDQKMVAWLLAVAATGALVTGTVMISNQTEKETEYALVFEDAPNSGRIQTGQDIFIVGAGLAIGSTILFIQAHRNKHKANLSLQSQHTSIYLPSNVTHHVQGLTVSIPIGK